MAFAISIPTPSFLHSSSSSSSSSSCSWAASSLFVFSNSGTPAPKNAVFYHFKGIPQLGFASFSQWNGLKRLGPSISRYAVKIERRGQRKVKGVYASLFGVGAPEALVIGVVALLVFGPKGLAEIFPVIHIGRKRDELVVVCGLSLSSINFTFQVARNLGKTLRAFQPTIKELQEVSREFKNTLEREIGLDDIDNPVPKNSTPNIPKPTPEESVVEDSKTDVEPDASASETGVNVTEAQLRGVLARLQQEQEEERAKEEKEKEERQKLENQSDSSTHSQDTPQASNNTSQETSSATTLSQDTPQASDDFLQEAAPVDSSSQNAGSSSALQEAVSASTTASETS